MYKFRIGESVAIIEPGVFATGVISGITGYLDEDEISYAVTLDPEDKTPEVSVSESHLVSLGLMPESDRLRLTAGIPQPSFEEDSNLIDRRWVPDDVLFYHINERLDPRRTRPETGLELLFRSFNTWEDRKDADVVAKKTKMLWLIEQLAIAYGITPQSGLSRSATYTVCYNKQEGIFVLMNSGDEFDWGSLPCLPDRESAQAIEAELNRMKAVGDLDWYFEEE